MRRPLAIDLFCGLGGWTEGFLAEDYDCIGFDIERHVYGTQRYPAQLVLQDVLTLHGSQFRDATVIVASPPCQDFSYMAMPWKRAKKMAEEIRSDAAKRAKLTALFDTCFRIQREASEAAGHHIPLIVENVKGAQPWVGRARWHFGSFYLWGDVPALMPHTARMVKVEGFNFHQHEKTGKSGGSFQSASVVATKNNGGSRFAIGSPGQKELGKNPVNGTKGTGGSWFTPTEDGRTVQGHWRDSGCVTRCYNSKDSRRKAASALIAKIPFPLAQHIARCYKPIAEDLLGSAGEHRGLGDDWEVRTGPTE